MASHVSFVCRNFLIFATYLLNDVRFYLDESLAIRGVSRHFMMFFVCLPALNEIEPLVYLTPFLEVIRSEDTTGPITGLALTAVDKFLSYGLLELPDPNYSDVPTSGPGSRRSVAMAAEAIADSGTQARFVGTERSSDEVSLTDYFLNYSHSVSRFLFIVIVFWECFLSTCLSPVTSIVQ